MAINIPYYGNFVQKREKLILFSLVLGKLNLYAAEVVQYKLCKIVFRRKAIQYQMSS